MIRFEPRRETRQWYGFVTSLIALGVAAAISGIVLMFAGHDPLEVYRRVISAGFTAPGAFSNTLLSAAPLAFAGLAAGIAFRMQAWNIGGEGQLYLGAIGSSGIGLVLGSEVPTAVSIAAMIVSGIVAGALWAAIPAFLRTRMDCNEILTTLMLNYVAGLLAYYLIFGSYSHWRDQTSPAGKLYPEGKILDPSAFWPGIPVGDVIVPFGFALVLFAALALQILLHSTSFGFNVRVVGSSPLSGKYAGMNTNAVFIVVMLLSGALAGLGGATLVGDFAHQLDPKALPQSAYGYTGIVAAALARYNPPATVLSAILLGALANAGFVLQGPGFPLGLVGTMQGIILFCVLAAEYFERYRIRIRQPNAVHAEHGASQPTK
jgi:general nucleoside transport system permease protein